MPKKHPAEVVLQAKRLYVEDLKTVTAAAHEVGVSPAIVGVWARKKDEDGLTWHDYRAMREDQMYEEMSPKALAKKILEVIWQKVRAENVNADEIVKLTKSLNSIVEEKYKLPTMYEMLRDLIDFIQTKYPHLIAGTDLITAISEFRAIIRQRLG